MADEKNPERPTQDLSDDDLLAMVGGGLDIGSIPMTESFCIDGMTQNFPMVESTIFLPPP